MAFSGESPKSASALAFVTVSRMSSVTFPDMPLSEALLTTTFSSARSPSRRKRGTYGRTINSLTLFVSFVSAPALRSFVTAWIQTFQDVTESGTVNSIEADPSGPVSRCGFQNAVSEKFERSAVAGSPAAAIVAAFCRLSPARPSSFRSRSSMASAGAEAGSGAAAARSVAAPDFAIAYIPRRPGPPRAYPP